LTTTVAGRPSTRDTVRPALVIGALGVVFGDIGTSPIYTPEVSARSRRRPRSTHAGLLRCGRGLRPRPAGRGLGQRHQRDVAVRRPAGQPKPDRAARPGPCADPDRPRRGDRRTSGAWPVQPRLQVPDRPWAKPRNSWPSTAGSENGRSLPYGAGRDAVRDTARPAEVHGSVKPSCARTTSTSPQPGCTPTPLAVAGSRRPK
jgi:hypothetical protein